MFNFLWGIASPESSHKNQSVLPYGAGTHFPEEGGVGLGFGLGRYDWCRVLKWGSKELKVRSKELKIFKIL